MSLNLNGLEDLRIVVREERIRQGLLHSDISAVAEEAVLGFENGDEGVAVETVFLLTEALGIRFSVDLPSHGHVAGPDEPVYDTEVDIDLDEPRGFRR